MPFSMNQIVWARSKSEDWQPGFVIDVTNDIWSFWSEPIEPFRPGHRHVFIIGSKSIELVKELDSIRDFCLGYTKSYESVAAGSDTMKALPLLVQMAAILSGEEIYPGQDWDWQRWAISSIQNCEPIRVSKKFYEKFTKKSRVSTSPPLQNTSSPPSESALCVSDDGAKEMSSPAKQRLATRVTNKVMKRGSPVKLANIDVTTLAPEADDSSETMDGLRTSQLVWAYRSGGLKERWWPAVLIEVPPIGSSTAIVVALNKSHDLFSTKITYIEDFCKHFYLRLNRVDLNDPEERNNYTFAVRKAVEYAQDAIGGVACEEGQWLTWALHNLSAYGGGLRLTAFHWNDLSTRTQNQLVQLKRREMFGSEQRASNTEQASSKGSWKKCASPSVLSKETYHEKKQEQIGKSKGNECNDIIVSDVHQLEDQSRPNFQSSKKRRTEDDFVDVVTPPTIKKTRQSCDTSESVPTARKSLPTGEGRRLTLMKENEGNEEEVVEPARESSRLPFSPKTKAVRRSNTPTNFARLLLPLDAGWSRKITIRRSDKNGFSDVYYYFPKGVAFKGKKCRSGKELAVLLQQNQTHPACRNFDALIHFSFNGNVLTGHAREIVHTAGQKTFTNTKASTSS